MVRCNRITRARECLQGVLEESLAKKICKRLGIWSAEANSERESQKVGDNALRSAFLGLVYCLPLLLWKLPILFRSAEI